MSKQQLETLIQMFRSQPFSLTGTIAEAREGFEKMAGAFPVAEGVRCEPVTAGGIKSEWIAPAGADAGRSILYLHGGGYAIGSLATHRGIASRIAKAANARVLLTDYRLAPEHPFPAAVEDAIAAYRWMQAQGLRPERMTFAGDSAGGGLTIAALVAARDAKLKLPAAGVCLSPWVDLEGVGESMTTKAGVDPMVTREALRNMATAYLGSRNLRTPLAAPLYAELTLLPPLLIQVGEAEILLDDATRLAARARKAGVAVSYEAFPDLFHVFQAFAPVLDEGQQAIDRIGAFVKELTP